MKKTLCIVLVLVLAVAAIYFGVQSNKANTQIAAAQADLEAATAELTTVQADLEAAAAELETVKAELEAATAAAAELETVKAELEAANAAIAELEAAAATTEEPAEETTVVVEETAAEEAAVMTYEEYAAAELDTEVVVETYVQAKQGWWDNTATVYTQDENGAYFLYNMACSEEDYEKLTVGTKIRVTGYKAEWAGEVEIIDATFEIVEGNFVAEAMDVTELLGTEELINHQNKFVSFKGMTVEPSVDPEGNEVAFLYNWDGSGAEGTDSDLYFNVSVNGQTYNFVVEYYLTGADSDVYKAVQALNVGDVIDMEGFLYWYEGVNPHITSVVAAE